MLHTFLLVFCTVCVVCRFLSPREVARLHGLPEARPVCEPSSAAQAPHGLGRHETQSQRTQADTSHITGHRTSLRGDSQGAPAPLLQSAHSRLSRPVPESGIARGARSDSVHTQGQDTPAGHSEHGEALTEPSSQSHNGLVSVEQCDKAARGSDTTHTQGFAFPQGPKAPSRTTQLALLGNGLSADCVAWLAAYMLQDVWQEQGAGDS